MCLLQNAAIIADSWYAKCNYLFRGDGTTYSDLLRKDSKMLVLSRKTDESIVIPELGIEIKVISTSGGRVRLGINAPREIAVHRAEVFERAAPRREVNVEVSGTPQRGLHV